MHRKVTGNIPKETGDLFLLSGVRNITRAVRHFEEKFTRTLYCTIIAGLQAGKVPGFAPQLFLTEARNASKANIKKTCENAVSPDV